jgi:hypothetical protein
VVETRRPARDLGERREGREPDASRDHEGPRRRLGGPPRIAERPQARDALAWPRGIEQRGRDADALVEQRDAGRLAARIAEHLEDRERTPKQGVMTRGRLDHHELPWRGTSGNRRRGNREHVVVGRQR